MGNKNGLFNCHCTKKYICDDNDLSSINGAQIWKDALTVDQIKMVNLYVMMDLYKLL